MSEADRYRETLEMHAGNVNAAENDLDRARDGLAYWIGDAVMRGVLTEAEVADAIGDTVDYVRRIVDAERRRNRHTGIRD